METDQANIQMELEQTTIQLQAKCLVAQAFPINEYVLPSKEEVYNPEFDLTAHIVATVNIMDTEVAEKLQNKLLKVKVTHNSILTSIENLIS